MLIAMSRVPRDPVPERGESVVDPDVWDLLADAEDALREQNAQDLHRVLSQIIDTQKDGLGPGQRAELHEQFYAVGRALVRLDPEWGKGWIEDSFLFAEVYLRERHEKLLASPSLLLDWLKANDAGRARYRAFVTRVTRPDGTLPGDRSVMLTRVTPAAAPPDSRASVRAGASVT